MARSTLPTHPRTGLVALGYRKDGRPIYPILGGSEPPAQPPASGPASAPAPAPPASAPGSPDKGFPEGTPLERMTVEQREAYWKHHARKHEDRVKAFGDLTPEGLTELREKAQRADALDFELMSEKDKAVAEAAAQARLVAEAEFMPRLVDAEVRAEAARAGADPEKLQASLDLLDRTKLLTENGELDTAKVKAFVGSIAPATGTPQRPPISLGQGSQPPSYQKKGDQGRAMAAKKFGVRGTG